MKLEQRAVPGEKVSDLNSILTLIALANTMEAVTR